MGNAEILLLVIAATILAVNQGLRDAPSLTGKFQFLKPKSWWNYVPFALVLMAGIVWLFSFTGSPKPIFDPLGSEQPQELVGAKRDPKVLPESVSAMYVELMSRDHTKLQEQRFLRDHAGRYLNLSLKLAYLEHRNGILWGQFYAGENADVFVAFSTDWEDHLLEKNVGEVVEFQAKIVNEDGRGYTLGEARLL